MVIEDALIKRVGEAGKKLHTGRSRNDQVATDFLMWMHDASDDLCGRGGTLEQLCRAPQVDGVLVLADIFGATPSNVAQKLVDGVSSRLITGVNLPMLLRAVTYRHEALDTLVSRAVVGGTQGVMQVAITAPQNQRRRDHDPEDHHHQQ